MLAQAAQGGGGITVPGRVEEMFRCCTEGPALVGNIGGRWMAGLDDLEVFPNLNNFVSIRTQNS